VGDVFLVSLVSLWLVCDPRSAASRLAAANRDKRQKENDYCDSPPVFVTELEGHIEGGLKGDVISYKQSVFDHGNLLIS